MDFIAFSAASIFNPLAPCGARHSRQMKKRRLWEFSIHSPLAGRDHSAYPMHTASWFFNPLAPCGARQPGQGVDIVASAFSIHSPLAGRDRIRRVSSVSRRVFNPLAPCGARRVRRRYPPSSNHFQSTRPLRGETPCTCGVGQCDKFSIHSPLAGRDLCYALLFLAPALFSIHSPLAGRDSITPYCFQRLLYFQSTRPLRGETGNLQFTITSGYFSIHSPLAGRDVQTVVSIKNVTYFSIHSPLAGRDTSWPTSTGLPARVFNPLAPCGARPPGGGLSGCVMTFQSTRPLRGETEALLGRYCGEDFSIHSPLAGRDAVAFIIYTRCNLFNPLAPCGARLSELSNKREQQNFSIHSPLAGRDTKMAKYITWACIFQSTRPLRGETVDTGYHYDDSQLFNPLAPCGARRGCAA